MSGDHGAAQNVCDPSTGQIQQLLLGSTEEKKDGGGDGRDGLGWKILIGSVYGFAHHDHHLDTVIVVLRRRLELAMPMLAGRKYRAGSSEMMTG